MKERGMIFAGEMPTQIIEGVKFQTRRPVRPQPDDDVNSYSRDCDGFTWLRTDELVNLSTLCGDFKCPYGKVGDRLWVKEDFHVCDYRYPNGPIEEFAQALIYRSGGMFAYSHKWLDGKVMPRWASRILLEIVSVRVERLNEISPEDLAAEGFPPDNGPMRDGTRLTFNGRKECFAEVWDYVCGYEKRGFGWDLNPWVFVIEFLRVEA